jgi:hypothetical protein
MKRMVRKNKMMIILAVDGALAESAMTSGC